MSKYKMMIRAILKLLFGKAYICLLQAVYSYAMLNNRRNAMETLKDRLYKRRIIIKQGNVGKLELTKLMLDK